MEPVSYPNNILSKHCCPYFTSLLNEILNTEYLNCSQIMLLFNFEILHLMFCFFNNNYFLNMLCGEFINLHLDYIIYRIFED